MLEQRHAYKHQFNTSQEMWIIIIKLLYIQPANIVYTLNKESKLNKCHFILGHKQRKLRGVRTTLLQTKDLSGLVVQWVSVVLPPPVMLWTRKHFLSDTEFRQQYNSEGHTTGYSIHECTYWCDRIPRGSSGQCNQQWTWQLHQYHLSSHWCICCNISRILKEVLIGGNIIQQLK